MPKWRNFAKSGHTDWWLPFDRVVKLLCETFSKISMMEVSKSVGRNHRMHFFKWKNQLNLCQSSVEHELFHLSGPSFGVNAVRFDCRYSLGTTYLPGWVNFVKWHCFLLKGYLSYLATQSATNLSSCKCAPCDETKFYFD